MILILWVVNAVRAEVCDAAARQRDSGSRFLVGLKYPNILVPFPNPQPRIFMPYKYVTYLIYICIVVHW